MTKRDGTPRGAKWIGEYGEKIARDYLRTQGIRILRCNFRAHKGGEVDLIARDGKLLLFVEVKTRKHSTKIRPLDAVDGPKQRLIERGANAWLKKLGTRDIPWRFDVIEVYLEDGRKPDIRWIRNAF